MVEKAIESCLVALTTMVVRLLLVTMHILVGQALATVSRLHQMPQRLKRKNPYGECGFPGTKVKGR
jgi:hypothetical protein